MVLNKRVTAVLFAGLLATATHAALAAESVNFVSWGGSTQDAQKQAWADPFSKASGITVVQDGPTDYGKLKAMVESGNVQWDVVDVEADFALRAAAEGLLEPLDFSVIQRDKIDPRVVSDHGVGSFFFSFVLGYNEGKLGAAKPQDWTALFDTKTYPGKRALYKWPSPGVLELALLAERDGDRIYGVIRGLAGSSDGRSLGLTAPRKMVEVGSAVCCIATSRPEKRAVTPCRPPRLV